MCKDFTLNKQSFLNPNYNSNIKNISQGSFTVNNDQLINRKTTFNPSNVNVVYPLNLDNLETRTVSTISRKNTDNSRINIDNIRIEHE